MHQKEYLHINLTKEMKDLYIENYQTLMKEIEDTNKWEDLCHSASMQGISKTCPLSLCPYAISHDLLRDSTSCYPLYLFILIVIEV